MNIDIILKEHNGRRAKPPVYGSEGAAAADLAAFIDEAIVLNPNERYAVPTGIFLGLPEGYCAIIMARSGLALKSGITMANGVGLIDSDYRGEIKVALINQSDSPFVIEDGMRIAQMAIMPAPQFAFTEVESLDKTKRGEGGFGSTGVKPL